MRPARLPVLTWVPSSVPFGNNIQDTFLIRSATDTTYEHIRSHIIFIPIILFVKEACSRTHIRLIWYTLAMRTTVCYKICDKTRKFQYWIFFKTTNMILIFWLLLKWSLFFILTAIHSYYLIQEVIVELDSEVFFMYSQGRCNRGGNRWVLTEQLYL